MRRSQAKQQEAARRAWAGGQEGKRKRYRGAGRELLTRMTLSVGQGPSHQWPVGLSSFGGGGVILSAGKVGGGGAWGPCGHMGQYIVRG